MIHKLDDQWDDTQRVPAPGERDEPRACVPAGTRFTPQ